MSSLLFFALKEGAATDLDFLGFAGTDLPLTNMTQSPHRAKSIPSNAIFYREAAPLLTVKQASCWSPPGQPLAAECAICRKFTR